MDIKRKNGDPGIDYYVNDSGLDLKALNGMRVIVLGERHNNADDLALLARMITELKPDYVLLEGLGDYVLGDKLTKELKNNAPVKSHYYEGFTKRWIEFSLKYDVPFIGIEYTDLANHAKDVQSDYKESFKLREAHFIKMIDAYAKKGKVIAVLGDTHVRTIETEVLGAISPVYLRYNGKKNSAVIRSAEGEIE